MDNKKFIVAKDSDFPEEMEVKVYNEGCRDVFGELGIGEERLNYIGQIIHISIQNSNSYSEAISKVSKKINSANELAVACIIIGRAIGSREVEIKQEKKEKQKQ